MYTWALEIYGKYICTNRTLPIMIDEKRPSLTIKLKLYFAENLIGANCNLNPA